MEVFFQMRFAYCGKPDGIALRRKKSKTLGEKDILRQFDLLERITLPSLRDQADPTFRLTMLCSARMPDDGKEHLDWLLNHYLPGRSSAMYVRPMIPGRVFRRQMQGLNRGDDPVIQTQLCEGEGFGVDFVQRLREHGVEQWAGLPADRNAKAAKGTFLSFRRGLRLGMRNKVLIGLEQMSAPKMPLALSLVARPSSRYNPMLINPSGLGVKFPHVSIKTQKPHCLRVIRGDQAAQMKPPERELLTQAEDQFSILRNGHKIFWAGQKKITEPTRITEVPMLRQVG